jgi:hypothetical protein
MWSSTGGEPENINPPAGNSVNIRPASVNACSLASADECAISENDVLATMFAEGEGGPK